MKISWISILIDVINIYYVKKIEDTKKYKKYKEKYKEKI